MIFNDLTGQNIQDTYQKVVQTDGVRLADGTGSLLPISFDGNNVVISGSLTAQTYVVSESILNVSSGSTVFGNSSDDTHQITGSLLLTGSALFETTGDSKVTFLDPGLNTNPNVYSTQIQGGNINMFGGGLSLNAGAIQGNQFQHYGDFDTQIEFPDNDEFLVKVGGVETLHILPSSISASGHITASGNISSSGTGSFRSIEIRNTSSNPTDDPNGRVSSLIVEGAMSASGMVKGRNFISKGFAFAEYLTSPSSYFDTSTNTGTIYIGNMTSDKLFLQGKITASANISASGDIEGDTIIGKTGSFGYLEPSTFSDLTITNTGSFSRLESPSASFANMRVNTLDITSLGQIRLERFPADGVFDRSYLFNFADTLVTLGSTKYSLVFSAPSSSISLGGTAPSINLDSSNTIELDSGTGKWLFNQDSTNVFTLSTPGNTTNPMFEIPYSASFAIGSGIGAVIDAGYSRLNFKGGSSSPNTISFNCHHGQITASIIQASNEFIGNLTGNASTATAAAGLTGTPDISVNHVTASGNISASAGTTASFDRSKHREIISTGGPFNTPRYRLASGSLGSYSEGIITVLHYNPTIKGIVVGTTTEQLFYQGTTHQYLSGRVVIGASDINPSSKLVVHGSASIHGNITASGHITASGNANIGGTISGSNLSGTNTGDQSLVHLAVTGSDVLFANITSSGNISSSYLEISHPTEDVLAKFKSGDRKSFIQFEDVDSADKIYIGSSGSDAHYRSDGGGHVFRVKQGGVHFQPLSINSSHITASRSIIMYSNGLVNSFGNQDPKIELHRNGMIFVKYHITASGNISSSGNVYANGLFIRNRAALGTALSDTKGNLFPDANITSIQIGKSEVNTSTIIHGDITASNHISASSDVKALNLRIPGIQASSGIFIDALSTGKPTINANSNVLIIGAAHSSYTGQGVRIYSSGSGEGLKMDAPGNITASGNISASYTSTGSFGSVKALGNIVASGMQHTLGPNGEFDFEIDGGTKPTLTIGKTAEDSAVRTIFKNEQNVITIGIPDSGGSAGLYIASGSVGLEETLEEDSQGNTPGGGPTILFAKMNPGQSDNRFVGVGTALPSKRLTVHGDISASGNLYVAAGEGSVSDGGTIFNQHLSSSGNISSSTSKIGLRDLGYGEHTTVGTTAQGDIINHGSTATIPGAIYSFATNGNVLLAQSASHDADGLGTILDYTGSLFMAVGTNSSQMLMRGIIKCHTPHDAIPGQPLYLSNNGSASLSPPTTTNAYARIIGHAISGSGTIYFNPDNTYVTVS